MPDDDKRNLSALGADFILKDPAKDLAASDQTVFANPRLTSVIR
jgi:hypothetical protein